MKSSTSPHIRKPILYKYFNFEGAKGTLEGTALRLKSPSLFNDPFDMRFKIIAGISADEMLEEFIESYLCTLRTGELPPLPKHLSADVARTMVDKMRKTSTEESMRSEFEKLRPYFRQHFEDRNKEIDKTIQALLGGHFIGCLTELNDSLLMWSHYGDQHQGAVIGFRTSGDGETFFGTAEKVIYSDSFPRVGTGEEWKSKLKEEGQIDVERLYREATTTKGKDWEYEREWRLVAPMPRLAGAPYIQYAFEPEDVMEVYLGNRMSPERRADLVRITREKYPHALIFKTELREDTYGVKYIRHE